MKKELPIDEELLFKLIGARLKQLRIEKGFTNYEHFAYDNSISRTQYGKYETGSNIQILTLFKILRGLNISFEEFFSQGFDELFVKNDE